MTRQRRRRAAAVASRTAPRGGRTAPPVGARLARQIRRVVQERPLVVVLALIVLHIGFALLSFEPRPHTGGDNAAYITLGRSLLEDGTYTERWDPQQPPHTKYPPVFPAILALAMAVGLTPWVQLKLVVLACSATGIAMSFLWIRGRRRPLLALGVATLLAVAPGVLREGRWILSDVPFFALTMVAVWAFDRVRPNAWPRFALAAVATLCAYFTRSAGLPLALAAIAWLAWRRGWKQLAALVLLIGIPAVLWWLRGRAYGPAGYVSEFWLINPYAPDLGRIGVADLFARMLANAQKYISIHMAMLLAGATSSIWTVLSSVIALLGLYGWARRLRRPRVADVFLPLYVGLIFVWPAVWSGERFLLPALPFILYYAGDAVTRIARRCAPRLTVLAGATAFALMLALAMPGLVNAIKVGRACTGLYREGVRYPCLGGPAWDEFFRLAEMMPRVLPDDAVVLSRKPRLFYVLSGLRGRNYPLSPEPAAFFATTDSVDARYVVFDQLDAVSAYYLRPVLARRAGAFCLLGGLPNGTTLFGILPHHAMVPDGGAAALNNTESIVFATCGDEFWRSREARMQLLGQ